MSTVTDITGLVALEAQAEAAPVVEAPAAEVDSDVPELEAAVKADERSKPEGRLWYMVQLNTFSPI